MVSKTLSLIPLLLLLNPPNTNADHKEGHLNYAYLNTTLPKPLSDITATYVSSKIYVFGGCDSPDGNERLPDGEYFYCASLSKSAYAFDPVGETFETLKDMPRERYRHTAAVIEGKIWVLGGRDVDDAIITEVDVYDIASNTWNTPMNIPQITSDLTSFSHATTLYVTGGYDSGYTATNATFSIDTSSSDLSNITERANLTTARGDIHAVVEGGYAYVTGGFTHLDEWCAPHNSAERYSLEEDKWMEMDDLAVGRADKALVTVNGLIIAMGGETKSACDGDPAHATKPIDDVEVLNVRRDGLNAEWEVMHSLPDDRFRFTAAPYPEGSSIYVFGGQKFFDKDCNCFATSDLILKYDVPSTSTSGSVGRRTSGIWRVVVGVVIGFVALAF